MWEVLRDPVWPTLGGLRGDLHIHLQIWGKTCMAKHIPELPVLDVCVETKKNDSCAGKGGGGGRR